MLNAQINALLTDLYQLTMMSAYFKTNQHRRVVAFEYFYRTAPFGGLYAVSAGLDQVIQYLQTLRFTEAHLAYLRQTGLFDDAFLAHLAALRFTGSLSAMREGEVLLPGVHGVSVIAALEEAQLIESALLTLLNFPTLIATKASHVKFNAEDKPVLEFGLRRAQGVDGALTASRAAYIGGADATSNVLAGMEFGIPIAGTHAHSYVMFYPDERDAFQHYAEIFPQNALFLVDTYDIYEGLRNAIQVAADMREKGLQARGVRIDSGDLVYWSIIAHVLFEAAAMPTLRIVLSNDLDERKIAMIHNEIRRNVRDEGYLREIALQVGFPIEKIAAEAVIDRLSFGVGTELVTGGDQSALGGVYKLVAVAEGESPNQLWLPRVKLSAQPEKVTNPGLKKVVRLTRSGFHVGELICLPEEVIEPGMKILGVNPKNPLQQTLYQNFDTVETIHVPIFQNGQLVYTPPSLPEVKAYARQRLKSLRLESRRLDNPHTLKVSLTESYWQYKQMVIERVR
ncbi:MAG TPA: nicotinate phosphoribosyltransferase [Aggregatilineales bacterium]|nr:nicotinate phosphoribosyltransferase [Aggregatilineales bacterium]